MASPNMNQILQGDSNPPPISTKVTFGIPSLLKETPMIAKTIAQGTVYVVGIVNIALASFPQIPVNIKAEVAGYTGGILVFVNAVCQMFGVQVTNSNSTKP